MAGGIFTPTAFHPNPKCIFVSLFLVLSYWILPSRNIIVAVFVVLVSYVALSWYDYLYECNQKMLSGSAGLSLTSIFKPQESGGIHESEQYKLLSVEEQRYVYLKTVYMFHLFIVAPLMIYAGFSGYNEHKGNEIIYTALSLMGLSALVYHGGRLFGGYYV